MSDIKDIKDTKAIQPLLDDAKGVYGLLKKQFVGAPTNNYYWQLGCCFDTMTDALRILGPGVDPGLAKWALSQYNLLSGSWYDDFAWWAIASAKAYDPAFAAIFGEFTESFKGIAQGCWSVLDEGLNDGVHNGAPQAYDNRDNQSFFTTPPAVPSYWAAPRVDNRRGSGVHGVWQTDIFVNIRDDGHGWTGPREVAQNPSKPSSCATGPCVTFGPYQTTVVNALYFLNAVRLEQARKTTHPGIPPVAQQLRDEYGFLATWMGNNQAQPISPGDSLLSKFGDGTALVRERVSTYAPNSIGNYPPVENWDARTSWGGDQGLLINAFAGYLQLFPNDTMSRTLLPMLVFGYTRHMVDPKGAPQPYVPADDPKLWGDDGDYRSGIGVFMRGVLQAARISGGPVSQLVRQRDFQTFLTRAVTWAQAAQPTQLFDYLNVLATLLAGIELTVPAHLQVDDAGPGQVPQPRHEG